MRLARKIWNRLRREVRHTVVFARAKCFDTRLGPEDVLEAWHRPSTSGMDGCLREWMEGRPRLLDVKLDLPLHEQKVMVCAEAERVMKGELEIYGESYHFALLELWFCDPKTHRLWPSNVHFTRFPIFHPSRDGSTDIRRIWEIGRFDWAFSLARAYGMTHRPLYAKVWGDYVRDFIQRNPPEFGPHWLNAMEVPIRAIQWSRALAIFFEADRVSGKVPDADILGLKEVLASLLDHGRYIRNHLEWTPHGRTNHYLADLVGLLALSVFVPQFRESHEWRSLALESLEREMGIQTAADGFHAEGSTAYHHFVIELYQLVQHMNREHGLKLSDAFHTRLIQMMETDRMIRGAEDLDPRIGDDDSGKLGVPHTGSVPQGNGCSSVALRHAGIYILRSDILSCHVACGPNGQQGVGGHAHNDKLSVVIRLKGRPLIVDGGTGCYSADTRIRNRFRSTAMHNTITVNQEEQNELRDWRMLRDRTRAHAVIWKDSNEETFFEGEHFGYKHLGRIHRRVIQLDKKRGRLKVLDEIVGEGENRCDLYLHFAPELDASMVKLNANRVKLPGAELIFEMDGTLLLETSVHSPMYGVQVPNLMLHATAQASGTWTCSWECRAIF